MNKRKLLFGASALCNLRIVVSCMFDIDAVGKLREVGKTVNFKP